MGRGGVVALDELTTVFYLGVPAAIIFFILEQVEMEGGAGLRSCKGLTYKGT